MDGARVVTPTVPQGDAWECGVAALAILMGYYGCHVPLEELRRATGVSRQGSNFLQMRDAARRYGLRARVFRKSPEHLAEAGFPCIVHMNFNHFVVVEGMRNGRVFLNDQGCGPHDISWDEFDEGFTGLVMTLEPGEEAVLRRRPPARWLILCRQLLPARRALVAAALTSMVYGLAIAGFAWSLAARLDEAAGPGSDAISAASRLPRLGRKITPSPRYSGERVGVRGNAVKDFGSRIRQNSGVWRESPKSGDFGYDVRAGFCPRQNPSRRWVRGLMANDEDILRPYPSSALGSAWPTAWVLLALLSLVGRGYCLEKAGDALVAAHVPRALHQIFGLPSAYFTLRFPDGVAAHATAGRDLAILATGPLGTTLLDMAAAGIVFVALWLASPVFGLAACGLIAVFLTVLWRLYGRREGSWRRVRHTGEEAVGFSAGRLANIESAKLAGRDAETFSGIAGMQANSLNAAQPWWGNLACASLVAWAGVAVVLVMVFTWVASSTLGPALSTGQAAAGVLLLSALGVWLHGLIRQGSELSRLQDLAVELDELYAHEPAGTGFAIRGREAFEPVPEATSACTTALRGRRESSNSRPRRPRRAVVQMSCDGLVDGPDSHRRSAPANSSVPTPHDAVPGTVTLENVRFGYSTSQPPLLDGASLWIQPGQHVGLTGESGVGKSTLARLVCGLHDPWEGKISVTGECAFVGGYPTLFEGSVRDNVTLWDARFSEGEVIAALQDACLWDCVVSRDKGLDAGVRADGSNLSGGQRRRLMIARALVHRPGLLVLDETLDSLDATLAEEILARLRCRGCTVLLVTRRNATLAGCEAVHRVNAGRVVPEARPENVSLAPVSRGEGWGEGPNGECRGLSSAVPESEIESSVNPSAPACGGALPSASDGAPFRMSECPREVLSVLAAIARVLPGGRITVPDRLMIASQVEPVRAAAQLMGLYLRRVRLRPAGWWREDHGPLIAFRGDRPVALLPAPGSGYRIFDPVLGRPDSVDGTRAAELSLDAFMPYRRQTDRKTSLLRLLWQAWCAAKGDAALAIVGMAASWLVWLGLMLLPLVSWRGAAPTDQAFLALLSGLGIVGGAGGLGLAASVALVRWQGQALLTIQTAVWARLLRLPVAFFRYASPAQLAGWAEQTGELLKHSVSAPVRILSGATGCIAGLAVLACMDFSLATWACVLLIPGLLVPPLCAWNESRFTRQAFTCGRRNGALAQGLLRDILSMRILGTHRFVGARWESGFAVEYKLRRCAQRWRHGADIVAAIHPVAGLALFLAWSPEVSRVTLACSGFVFVFCTGLVESVAGAVAKWIRLLPTAERMRPILETETERREADRDIGPLDGCLTATGLCFTYPDTHLPALRDVSFHAAAGEIVALTGPSGSGKSTLVRLLLGFEEPAAGEIRYGEYRLDEIDREAARRWMDAVLQDELLPAATIRTHIAGQSPHSLDQVWEAARLACLDQDLTPTPLELQQLAFSDKLSTGQVQRIQIARALLHRPRILFLDETTSGLEAVALQEVLARIRAMRTTCILVTHRPDVIALADRVYVLHGGSMVAEHGTRAAAGWVQPDSPQGQRPGGHTGTDQEMTTRGEPTDRPKNTLRICLSAPHPAPLPGVPGRGSYFSAVPKQPLFRQKALDRLQTPELLDRLVTFPVSKSWLAIAAVGWLVLCLLAWVLLTAMRLP
ncbi:MAG: ATP-binding cassette domain-containing protein [Planctomycetota bacterium]|nr:ATP-binding cassette domain-containing protein [Planctomycetota bacterium]